MSAAVKQAIAKLSSAVGNLENAVKGVEKQMAGKQRDMFAAKPAAQQDNKEDGFGVDNAVIAQRLDMAIQKVEDLLRGGQ